MKTNAKYLVVSLLLGLVTAFAQTVPPPPEGNPAFTQQELDQMLAPIALYDDSLLSQILMAATYPLEVVEAARWSSANPALRGDVAVQAVDDQNWDPSVKSLVAFPQVLQTLNQKIEWTERLGDAFLSQQPQVMDTIQSLRQKAREAGNLNSNPEVSVTQSDSGIEVAAVNPEVIYVPYYDPAAAYGSWWWPDYPPVFWAPWAGYGWNGGFAWGVGIGVGASLLFGSWDWRNHRVFVGNPRHSGEGHPWQHDAAHRRGVPYRDASLARQFGRAVAAPASRAQFRGYESSTNARPVEAHNPVPLGSSSGERRNVPEPRQAMAPQRVSPPVMQPRANAFENIGRGADVRDFSARGHASLPGAFSAPASSRGSSRPPRR